MSKNNTNEHFTPMTTQLSYRGDFCNFGLKFHSGCGTGPHKVDLCSRPDLRDLIQRRIIAPYCFERIDADTVMVDRCLLCFLEEGFTAEDFDQRERQASGMTRKQMQDMVRRLRPHHRFEWLE